MKTLFIDVMLGERYQFTLRYRHCPASKPDLKDINDKILARRPSLKGKPYTICID